ncbi:Hypothetical predicted protein [Pelobates cultripes]|uniref:Secreted protein n=1 Tax=Pelobates cultripes TaxID=61616 RepID=A0AAD1RBU6_PELCU|nr:Hypothetical predicted protein [Pelobates cultripes]
MISWGFWVWLGLNPFPPAVPVGSHRLRGINPFFRPIRSAPSSYNQGDGRTHCPRSLRLLHTVHLVMCWMLSNIHYLGAGQSVGRPRGSLSMTRPAIFDPASTETPGTMFHLLYPRRPSLISRDYGRPFCYSCPPQLRRSRVTYTWAVS